MPDDYLFPQQGKKLDILKAISKGHSSATRIAKQLKLSVAYVNQQLKLMEAHKLIKRSEQQEKRIGKPSINYYIQDEQTILFHIGSQGVYIQRIHETPYNQFLKGLLGIEKDDTRYCLFKFYFTYEDLIQSSELVGLLRTKDEKIQLFFITEHYEKIRKEHSNITIKDAQEKNRHIAIWSHSYAEVEQGLKNNDSYYLEKLSELSVLFDKHKTLAKLKKTEHK